MKTFFATEQVLRSFQKDIFDNMLTHSTQRFYARSFHQNLIKEVAKNCFSFRIPKNYYFVFTLAYCGNYFLQFPTVSF